MACNENCKKDEAQTQNTQPAEAVAVTEQDAEQVTGGSNGDKRYFSSDGCGCCM